MYRFGYKGDDRNRYGHCVSCTHQVCEDCRPWNAANIAEMEAEDAAKPASDDTNRSPIPDLRGGTDEEDSEEDGEAEDSHTICSELNESSFN
jgi:hypothetical protein